MISVFRKGSVFDFLLDMQTLCAIIHIKQLGNIGISDRVLLYNQDRYPEEENRTAVKREDSSWQRFMKEQRSSSAGHPS